MYLNLAIVTLLTFLLNLPFGYWRSNVKKFSFLWFLFVHLPIPFIVLMRFGFHLGFQWWTYPFLVGAFFTGQLLGKKLGMKNELSVD